MARAGPTNSDSRCFSISSRPRVGEITRRPRAGLPWLRGPSLLRELRQSVGPRAHAWHQRRFPNAPIGGHPPVPAQDHVCGLQPLEIRRPADSDDTLVRQRGRRFRAWPEQATDRRGSQRLTPFGSSHVRTTTSSGRMPSRRMPPRIRAACGPKAASWSMRSRATSGPWPRRGSRCQRQSCVGDVGHDLVAVPEVALQSELRRVGLGQQCVRRRFECASDTSLRIRVHESGPPACSSPPVTRNPSR